MLIKIYSFCFVEGMLENVNDNVQLRKIGFIDKIWPYRSSKRVVCMRNRISTTGVNFSYLNLVHTRISLNSVLLQVEIFQNESTNSDTGEMQQKYQQQSVQMYSCLRAKSVDSRHCDLIGWM